MFFDLGMDYWMAYNYATNDDKECQAGANRSLGQFAEARGGVENTVELILDSLRELRKSSEPSLVRNEWWFTLTLFFIYLPQLFVVFGTSYRQLMKRYLLHKFQSRKPKDDDIEEEKTNRVRSYGS